MAAASSISSIYHASAPAPTPPSSNGSAAAAPSGTIPPSVFAVAPIHSNSRKHPLSSFATETETATSPLAERFKRMRIEALVTQPGTSAAGAAPNPSTPLAQQGSVIIKPSNPQLPQPQPAATASSSLDAAALIPDPAGFLPHLLPIDLEVISEGELVDCYSKDPTFLARIFVKSFKIIPTKYSVQMEFPLRDLNEGISKIRWIKNSREVSVPFDSPEGLLFTLAAAIAEGIFIPFFQESTKADSFRFLSKCNKSVNGSIQQGLFEPLKHLAEQNLRCSNITKGLLEHLEAPSSVTYLIQERALQFDFYNKRCKENSIPEITRLFTEILFPSASNSQGESASATAAAQQQQKPQVSGAQVAPSSAKDSKDQKAGN